MEKISIPVPRYASRSIIIIIIIIITIILIILIIIINIILSSPHEFHFVHEGLSHARHKRSLPHSRKLKTDPQVRMWSYIFEAGYDDDDDDDGDDLGGGHYTPVWTNT